MLRLKHLPIDTGKENIVFIHKRCPEFQTDDVNLTAGRIEIHGGLQPLFASVYVCEDETIVKPDEIALTNQAFHLISMAEGSEVAISPAPPPATIWASSAAAPASACPTCTISTPTSGSAAAG